MSYQRSILCKPKSPGNRPCLSPHPQPAPASASKTTPLPTAPMAEEAEIASVISLIQGMYINNVSVTMDFISILQSMCSVQCAVCSVPCAVRSALPYHLRLFHASRSNFLFPFLARHECAYPRDRRLGDRLTLHFPASFVSLLIFDYLLTFDSEVHPLSRPSAQRSPLLTTPPIGQVHMVSKAQLGTSPPPIAPSLVAGPLA
jgi:hypothetical protein